MDTQNKKRGTKAEGTARRFLENKGFSIEQRNYRLQHAEIDIIARKENLLIFVEVKTRTKNTYGPSRNICITNTTRKLPQSSHSIHRRHTMESSHTLRRHRCRNHPRHHKNYTLPRRLLKQPIKHQKKQL